MIFENTISLGNLITILIAIAGGVGFIWAIRTSVSVLNIQLRVQDSVIAEIKDEIKELIKVTSGIAVQGMRIDNIESRMLLEGKRIDDFSERAFRRLDMLQGELTAHRTKCADHE